MNDIREILSCSFQISWQVGHEIFSSLSNKKLGFPRLQITSKIVDSLQAVATFKFADISGMYGLLGRTTYDSKISVQYCRGNRFLPLHATRLWFLVGLLCWMRLTTVFVS